MPQKIFNFLIKIFDQIGYRIERFRKIGKRNKRANIEKKIILNIFKKRQIPRLSQFRYVLRFLSKKEKNAFFIFLGLTFISFFGIFTLVYLDNTKIVPSQGGEYTEGVVGYTRSINPLYSQNNEVDKDLVKLIYSGLVKRNIRGSIVVDLAKEYKLSNDETSYTFILRDDVKWHDGKKLSPDDVIFTIGAIKEKNYDSPLYTSWKDISVQKIDDRTIQFKLKKPFGSFLSLLTIGIMPKHIWEKVPVANINLAEANNKPIGTGPYRFKSFTKDKVGAIKSYQLELNKKFYGKKPNIERVTLKFYPDYVSAVGALDNRQIDGLAFVSAQMRTALKLKGRLEAHDTGLPQYNSLFLNRNRNSILQSKTIRQALAIAIDRKKIIKDALSGGGITIDGPILSEYLGYGDMASPFSYDEKAAEKLLVEAGWLLKDGKKYRTKGKKGFKLILTSIEKSQNVKAAGIIKNNWEKIGIEVELKIVSAANISSDVIDNRKYEVLLFGEMYGPDLDPYQYWHSSALRYPGLNLAQYNNRKADVLLEDARKSSDKVVKTKKYQEFEALLEEDLGAIFLWQPRYTYYIDKKIKGIKISNLLTPSDRLEYIMTGYVKTRRALR